MPPLLSGVATTNIVQFCKFKAAFAAATAAERQEEMRATTKPAACFYL
jgi:hypothetical protein